MTSLNFACPHCDQRFTVDVRHVGRAMNCPRCHLPLRIPGPEAAAVQLAERTARRQRTRQLEFKIEERSLEDLERHFLELQATRGDATGWHRMSTRARLFLGISMILLTLGTYFSYQAGKRWGGKKWAKAPLAIPPKLLHVHGHVRMEGGPESLPHPRAFRVEQPQVLVLLLPQGARLEERIPARVMSPDARGTPEQDLAFSTLQGVGGTATWCNADLTFALSAVRPGPYDLLVVAFGSREPAPVSKKDLARVGHFFVPAFDLLNQRSYELRHQTISRDLQLLIEVIPHSRRRALD